MISKTAIESLEELEAAGLKPTWADAIRLNALGLRLEGARGKRPADSAFLMPRVAAVSPEITFRQPTVGHEIWLAKAERLTAGDAQSVLALYCYALSRPWEKLCDPDVPAEIGKAVAECAAHLKNFTRDQLQAAIDYALFGVDASAGEYASHVRNDENGEKCDLDECVAVGVLNAGRAVLFGHSAADMKSMTVRELTKTIHDAYTFHNLSTAGEASRLEADYYATVDEIAERLKGSRNG